MRKYILNSPILQDRRRALRKNQTQAETIIWQRVRSRRLGGYRFTRQYSVGPYILDFYCAAKKLAVEIDGAPHVHSEGKSYDRERTAFLEGFGIKTIRFQNDEVLSDAQKVLACILTTLSCL